MMSQPKILTLEEILNANDLREQIVEVPQWGGAVKIRELTKVEQAFIRKEARGPDGQVDPEKLEILLMAYGLAEPKITLEQAQQLRNKSAAAWETILWAMLELNNMTEEAQKRMRQSFRPGNA